MSMLKTVWEAIIKLLGLAPAANAHTAPVMPEQAAAMVQAKPKKPRAPRAKELTSMGDLLESLDETFSALRLPFDKLSWVPRQKIVGLRKMGVHVVHPAYTKSDELGRSITVPANRILPAMICVSFGWSRSDNGDWIFPAVLFAVKENKLPAEVSKCVGQHYLFGIGFKLGAKSEHDASKELFWLAGYLTVRSDGSLYLHQELKPRQHTVPVRNPAARRAYGKTVTYTNKSWGKASLAQLYDKAAAKAAGEQLCINEFSCAMNWWLSREDNWSVAVRKDGERITFAVPKELTSRFFKDRIKVTNERGATKKIIHFVSEHERATAEGKTTVKEHIRGLADFDWKGYGCRVTAPKFNGTLSTEFTLAGTPFDDDESIPATGWVDMSKVGAILADVEEGRRVA